MRVLIADDHDLLCDALKSVLSAEPDFAVSTAADVPSALDLIRREPPFDVILLDFSMPGMNGFDGLSSVRAVSGEAAVGLMSGVAPPGVARRAIECGAAGFIPKTLPARSMVNAIRFMAAGERFLPVDLAGESAARTPDLPGQSLTPRERQVLVGLCQGKLNKEIARELGLSEPTIKLHVKLICRKLNARNRTHAAMIAKEAGLAIDNIPPALA